MRRIIIGNNIEVDSVAGEMNDYSYETEWYYDFDKQEVVARMREMDMRPNLTHELLPVERMSSREGFMHMVFCF